MLRVTPDKGERKVGDGIYYLLIWHCLKVASRGINSWETELVLLPGSCIQKKSLQAVRHRCSNKDPLLPWCHWHLGAGVMVFIFMVDLEVCLRSIADAAPLVSLWSDIFRATGCKYRCERPDKENIVPRMYMTLEIDGKILKAGMAFSVCMCVGVCVFNSLNSLSLLAQ